MDAIGVYNVKTDILKEDKTNLQLNVLGNNLVDAINSASYLKYNGESLGKHIISAEKFVDKVYQYTYSTDDLNPNYKQQEDEENNNTLPPIID